MLHHPRGERPETRRHASSWSMYACSHVIDWVLQSRRLNGRTSTFTLTFTSYYVQRMVSHARAENTHPVTSDTSFRPLYWVASSANNSSVFYLQIANIEQASVPITGTIKLANLSDVDEAQPLTNLTNLTRRVNNTKLLQADSMILVVGPGQAYNVTNDLDHLDAVVPVTKEITAALEGSQLVFNFTVSGWSFGVYKFLL